MKKNKQPLEENIGVLQDFIDLVRMQRKITEMTDTQAVDIQAIVDALPNQVVPHIDTHALILVKDKTPAKKVFQMRVSSPQHPLDSLLVKLIRALAEKNITRQHYARILYLPENRAALSDYERGVLSIIGVSSEKISDHAAYQKAMQNRKPGTVTAGLTPQAIDASPHRHLAPFITAGAYAAPPNLNDFTAAHEQLYMRLTMYLVDYFCNAQNRVQFGIPKGHPVVCLIVSKTGEILAFSVNTRSVDPTSHAETNALRIYFMRNPGQQHLPEGTRVFTSLKSCEMCAGGIVSCATPNASSVKVIYGQTDPAQINTVLHEKKLEQRCVLSVGTHADVFVEIDKIYEQQKAQEQKAAQASTQSVSTTNAAESLYTPAQQVHLQALTQHFIGELNTLTPSAVILHLRAFLQAIDVTFAPAAEAAPKTKMLSFK